MPVSKNNTKAQILDAYEKLLKDVAEKSKDNPKAVQERKQEVETVAEAEKDSKKNISDYIIEIKQAFLVSLETIEDKLTKEREKLSTIQKAIAVEQKNLEDLYGITTHADSLAAILLAQKEQKETFNEEMLQKKTQLNQEIEVTKNNWQKEKVAYQEVLKNEKESLLKTRKREEEEYQYNLQQNRKKDVDAFNTKKALEEAALAKKRVDFEEEFTKREKNVKENEEELALLKATVAKFPADLETAVSKVKAEVKSTLETMYKFETSLQAKETEGALNLKNHQIKSLEAKIKEMEVQLKEAGSKVSDSEKTVKDIALKAIEAKSSTTVLERRDIKE